MNILKTLLAIMPSPTKPTGRRRRTSTRQEAEAKLIALYEKLMKGKGPMGTPDLISSTSWTRAAVHEQLQKLADKGFVRRVGKRPHSTGVKFPHIAWEWIPEHERRKAEIEALEAKLHELRVEYERCKDSL